MYVGFPRKDGPINLIIVSNPTTCVRVYLSMWDADVRRVCACLQPCNRRIRPKCWEDTATALPLRIKRMSALQKTLQPVRYRNTGTTWKPRNKYATRRSHFVKKAPQWHREVFTEHVSVCEHCVVYGVFFSKLGCRFAADKTMINVNN